jgi:superoxide dismutase
MSLTLPPLLCALDALEPRISRRTLGAHHGRHHGWDFANHNLVLASNTRPRVALESKPAAEATVDDRASVL